MIYLFTDGAFSPKRNQGGAGYIIYHDNKIITSGGLCIPGRSNNFSEVSAAILGFSCIKQPIDELTIVSDSMYLIGCAWKGWSKQKNKYLWDIFDQEWNRVKPLIGKFEYVHVRGHQTDSSIYTKRNNAVDKLACYYSQL